MSSLPPGIVWLSQRLRYFLPPPLIVYLLRALLPVKPPTWLFVLILTSSFPAAVIIWVTLRDYLDYRRAKALNAVLPPRLQDWTPGSLKNLRSAVESFKFGYICMPSVSAYASYVDSSGSCFTADSLPPGLHTFNFRVLFENRVRRTYACFTIFRK
jgi:hypothetical protein